MTSIRVRSSWQPIQRHIDHHIADFKSKKIRINLNQPIKAEVTKERADTLQTVDEDRKYVIQATIVRYVNCGPLYTQSKCLLHAYVVL